MIVVERAAGGEEAAELFRGEGPSALVAEDPVRIDPWLRSFDVADGVGGDQAFPAGRFQDAQQDRPARHYAAVAQLALQPVLPAQDDGGGDLAQLPAAEVGAQVAAQVTFRGLHALGAAAGAGRPELPPVVGPLVEQDAAPAWVGPGVGGDLGEQFVLEVAGQTAGGEGLGALRAVVQPPPDLVACDRPSCLHRLPEQFGEGWLNGAKVRYPPHRTGDIQHRLLVASCFQLDDHPPVGLVDHARGGLSAQSAEAPLTPIW